MFNVGDTVLFDHFGSKDRRGTVVKITKSAIHVEWTAPTSGVTRVVRVSTVEGHYGYLGIRDKNVRVVSREAN